MLIWPIFKGQDILILLKLQDSEKGTIRSLGEALGLDPASVHRALGRLEEARLIDDQRRVNRSNAEEFLLHGFKYSFPPNQHGPSRGFPTAWAASPLKKMLARSDDPPPVWPDPKGRARGIALEPLHPKVPEIARRDRALAEQLALLDAIRLGGARIRALAADELRERLRPKSVAA